MGCASLLSDRFVLKYLAQDVRGKYPVASVVQCLVIRSRFGAVSDYTCE